MPSPENEPASGKPESSLPGRALRAEGSPQSPDDSGSRTNGDPGDIGQPTSDFDSLFSQADSLFSQGVRNRRFRHQQDTLEPRRRWGAKIRAVIFWIASGLCLLLGLLFFVVWALSPGRIDLDEAYAEKDCRRILQVLQDPRLEVGQRAQAAKLLARLAGRGEWLCIGQVDVQKTLMDSEPQVRHATAEAFGEAGPDGLIALLRGALQSQDPEVHAITSKVLERTRGLQRALPSTTHAARLAHVLECGTADAEWLTPHLNDTILTAEDVRIRCSAVNLSAKMGASAISVLLDAFERDESAEVRACIARAFAQFGADAKEAAALLVGELGDIRVRDEASRALNSIGLAALPHLAGSCYAEDPSRPSAVRWEALRSFTVVHRQAILGLLDDDSPAKRAAAAFALGTLESEEATALLLRQMNDESAEVRLAAVRAFGHLGSKTPDVIAALSNRLKDGSSPVVIAAARTLGDIGNDARAAAPTLAQTCLRNPPVEAKARMAIVTALLKIDSDLESQAVSAVLSRALFDEAQVWKATCRELRKRHPVSVPLLLVLLSETVAESAGEEAARRLAAFGEETVPVLLEATKESSPKARRIIIQALGRIALGTDQSPTRQRPSRGDFWKSSLKKLQESLNRSAKEARELKTELLQAFGTALDDTDTVTANCALQALCSYADAVLYAAVYAPSPIVCVHISSALLRWLSIERELPVSSEDFERLLAVTLHRSRSRSGTWADARSRASAQIIHEWRLLVHPLARIVLFPPLSEPESVPSPALQATAREALGRLGQWISENKHPDAIDAALLQPISHALIATLRTDSAKTEETTCRALLALAEINRPIEIDEAAQSTLLETLRNGRKDSRRAVAAILASVRPVSKNTTDVMLSALADPDRALGLRVAMSLGRLVAATELSVDVLIELLADERAQVQRLAARALGESAAAAREAIEPLRSKLDSSDIDLRITAVAALLQIDADQLQTLTDYIARHLVSPKKRVQRHGAALLERAEQAQLTEVIEKVSDARLIEKVETPLDHQSRGTPSDALRMTAQIWSTENPRHSFRASAGIHVPKQQGGVTRLLILYDEFRVSATGRFDPAVAGQIARALKSQDPNTRQTALVLLGRLGCDAKGASAAVRQLAEKDVDDKVRQTAARVIGQIYPEGRIVNESIRLLQDESASLADKHTVVLMLGQMETAAGAAVPALISLARSSDHRLSLNAIDSLGRVGQGDQKAVPFLEDLALTSEERRLTPKQRRDKWGWEEMERKHPHMFPGTPKSRSWLETHIRPDESRDSRAREIREAARRALQKVYD